MRDPECLKQHFRWVPPPGDGNCGCITEGALRNPEQCIVTGMTGAVHYYEIRETPQEAWLDLQDGVVTYKIVLPKSEFYPYHLGNKEGRTMSMAGPSWMWLRSKSADILENGCPRDFPYASESDNVCYNDLCLDFDPTTSSASPCPHAKMSNPCESWCSQVFVENIQGSGCGTMCGDHAARIRSSLHFDSAQECMEAIIDEPACMKTLMKYNRKETSSG